MLQDKVKVTFNKNKAFIPSIQHMIIHNVYTVQVNDRNLKNDNVFIRQMYDLRLLASKENVMKVAKIHGKKFNSYNTYFATINYLFSNPRGIEHEKRLQTKF